MLAVPLVLIVVSSALAQFDHNQEVVARSLGASRPRAFVMVTLPQIRFAVISGALLSFLTSFDEVILALFVSGGANSTLTRNMFLALRESDRSHHRGDLHADDRRDVGAFLLSQLLGRNEQKP